MAGFVNCLCIVLFLVSTAITLDSPGLRRQRITGIHPVDDFTKHTLVKPRIYHGREKRQVSSSRDKGNQHFPELTITLDIDGEKFDLDLVLNNHIIPKEYFRKYQENGKHKLHKPSPEEVELCYYTGKIRGKSNSWVALSTCSGLQGLIYDGREIHYIDRNIEKDLLERPHYLYKHSDLVESNHTCGHDDSHIENNVINKTAKFKRSTDEVMSNILRGPYKSTSDSRYLELVLVVDNALYKEFDKDLSKVEEYCISLTNIINGLYSRLNIYVALVGVVVWTESDEIEFSNDPETFLSNFLVYRRTELLKSHPNDNAQLLTKQLFENGVVSKALKGPICTYEFSGGVNTVLSQITVNVARQVAHSIGHNLGMEHDTSACNCPDELCIMSTSVTASPLSHWSSCSVEYLRYAFAHGMDHCLKNKPQSLIASPVCGNGFVEPGEQCDCGLPENCQSNCCNPETCKLFPNATCATGACCNQETCELKRAGTVCRSVDGECDLPEHCTGDSEYCPTDLFKMNSEVCGMGTAFCFDGRCTSRNDQCKLLWGETGESAHDICYGLNIRGSRYGNCGYDHVNKTFIKCDEEDNMCGRLHCKHSNERLEYGLESAAIMSHSFINFKGTIVPCRSAVIDLGLDEVDPGMVPNGAKCGDNKMCVDQKCVNVEVFQSTCSSNCNGNGVCNSLGNCHCFEGFAPPHCNSTGAGGSLDSGPTNDLTAQQHPTHDFINHTIIIPKVFHTREKRRVLNTKEEGSHHIPELTISIEIDNEEYILDLVLNKHIIPKGFFHKTQKNGKHHLHRPSDEEIDLCHYTGKVRGVPESWVALSTCSGLRGLFYDGTEMRYIERDGEEGLLERPHYLYKHSDLAEHNKTCGYEGDHTKDHDIHDHAVHNIYNRFKRSTEVRDRVRGPINASSDTKYLEFLLVIDNREYRELGESTSRISQHCITIANIINGLFSQLNIFVALVGVVIWSEHDEIGFSENGDITLTSFLHYRREKLIFEHPNDNAQLLTKFNFNNGVVGKALKGPICTYQFSGGINTDHSSVVALVASTIAHEIGHNFGMEHDTADCDCPDDKCIMSASSGSVAPVHWSSCSLRYLLHAFTHGMDYCLKNKPQSIYMSPICGNGFVEPGEECDCGLPENCQSNCCNPDTCQLYSNATCATGACCDQETCEPKRAGTVCRAANLECDLPEYCTGDSEFCPRDVFKMNSEVCGGGEAYCFDGLCRTRTDQCKLLWGETGESSAVQCYEQMNIKGNRTGNCGYDKLTKDYFKCKDEDVMCGMLQCKHLNERLEFGMESAAILSHSFINFHGVILPCRTAVIDLGLNETDPGLTPSGASCGDSKLCVNQKCVEVAKFRSTIKTCPNNCNGNGVCNSLGHCHCSGDFAPPFCEGFGTGGSIDSGPTRDPAGHKVFRNAMFIIFLGIIPFLALMFLLWYYAWKKHGWIKPSPPTLKSPGKSRGFQPEPARQTEDNHSLLQPETITSGQPNEFFGHFKGFSLKPLDKPEPEPSRTAPPPPYTPTVAKSATPEPVPIRSAPAPPCAEAKTVETTLTSKSLSPGKSLHVKSPVVMNKLNSVANAKNSFLHKPSKTPFFKQPAIKGGLSDANDTVVAPALPPPNPGSSARPIISSPVLENSTCTAKELISPLKVVPKVPCRSAPTAPVTATASETKRPLSSPEIAVNSVIPSSTSEEVRKTVNSTLNRIASFLKPADKKPAVQVSNTNSLPRNKVKANKIDKQTLRGIEISNPIPQTAIEIGGVTSLPVDQVDSKTKTAVVMRAQSMRGTNVTEKPIIHSFGSMRQPGKRPVSIPSGVRPKSPPPPLPSEAGSNNKIKNMSVYKQPRVKFQSNNQYDDCLNKETKSIGSGASNDNIYSVIEESPVKSAAPVPVPVPVPGQNTSESGDGLGLLGEIVSEISNRNQESIYSTSTLSKKKKEDEANKNKLDPSELELYENSALFSRTRTPESVYSNMNSTSSSSGYIQPNAINAPVRSEIKRTEQTEPKNDKPIFSTFRTEKPFTTFTKPEPPAPIYNNTNHTPPKSAPDIDKTNIRTKTPSPTGRGAKIARQTTPPNLKSKHSPTRKAPSPANLKSNRSVTNSPDLVTSCSTKPATKPPDVLGGSAMNKKPSILASKPSLPKGQTKGTSFRQTQDKKSLDVKPPVVGKIGKAAVDNNNSTKNSGSASASAGSKPVSRQNSNVASLQQKFEGKSNSAANSRPTIKSKA